jgi:hypothetical protein
MWDVTILKFLPLTEEISPWGASYHMALVVYNIQHLLMLVLFNYKTYF